MSQIRAFIMEEDGIGVVEIILILVILIGLVVLFKGKIEGIVKNALKSIETGSDKVIKG